MPADLEQRMAVFADVSRFDAAELVLTARYAERRAAPWIPRYGPRDFVMEPRSGDWDVCLHGNPCEADIDPDAASQ